MTKKRSMGKALAVGAVIIAAMGLGAGATYAWFMPGYQHGMMSGMQGHGGGMHGRGGGMHGHGGGMLHDEMNMPGLRGENATEQESEELAVMFRNFETMTRTVENLPNGIRTVTKSSDPEVMNVLISHAAGMINRVQEKDDPKIRIQSPTLDIFFQRGEEIETMLEVTDEGLVIVQTSENPELVTALQTHAAEVTAMSERGMAAVHEMMMTNGRSHQ